MRVYIGPYRRWIGPYQIANSLMIFGVSRDRCHDIGEWLSNTWVSPVCEWIDKFKKRTVKVRIDRYDTWNMNNTLAYIIPPMLQQLKDQTHGSAFVDDEDVPEHLRSTAAPPKKNEWDIDDNHHLRWEWVLDEMIWTFEQYREDCDWEAQYYSGEIDRKFVEIQETHFNPVTNKQEKMFEYVYGPNHTFKVDDEGLKKHRDRMDNGTRLFGKYYKNLWD